MVVQVVALATVFAGRQAEPWLAQIGVQLPPETWRALEEKKVMLLMGIWFAGERIGPVGVRMTSLVNQLLAALGGRIALLHRRCPVGDGSASLAGSP